MNNELLSALASAASWGAGDFSGGLASKRTSVYVVIVISQLLGGLLLTALALIFREPFLSTGDILWSMAAGMIGATGLLGLYHGLATGRMGVVAPVAAVVSAALPLVVGMIIEGVPTTLQLVGMLLALPAMWLISRPSAANDPSGGSAHWRELVLPAVAGLGLGGFLTIIGQVSDEAIFWPLVASRTAALVLLTTVALALRQWQRPSAGRLPLIFLAGLFDTGGNALYAFAAQIGRLDIASVLSSLFPASTLFLAWLILHERLTRPQGVGAVLALAAVMLIAA